MRLNSKKCELSPVHPLKQMPKYPSELVETLVLSPRAHVAKTLKTDTSLMGRRAILDGHSAQGRWRCHHLSWHINCLQMRALFLALKYLLPDLRGYHILVQSDNTLVVLHRSAFEPFFQIGEPDFVLGSGQAVISKSSRHPWAPESGGRNPVEAWAEAQGMETSIGVNLIRKKLCEKWTFSHQRL